MTTESTAALAGALAKVQAELPKIERDRTVTVETKKGDDYTYSYVTLAHLSDSILPLLAKHGLAFAAMPGAGADGKMCLRYHLLHESGERLSGEFPISGEGGIQMIGGRITYARRYCLAALVGVAADEDDESRLANEGAPRTAQRAQPARAAAATGEGRTATRGAARPPARTAQRAQPAAPPPLPGEDDDAEARQRRRMFALLRDAGLGDRGEGLAYLGDVIGRPVESTKDLTAGEVSSVIDRLVAFIAQQEPPAGGEDQ